MSNYLLNPDFAIAKSALSYLKMFKVESTAPTIIVKESAVPNTLIHLKKVGAALRVVALSFLCATRLTS